ncbi:MAG TPA: energy transducer TonB [Flavobacterium sp.]|jgi:protein TonB
MKLDILKGTWLDIVFEGRNKLYGAYELRKQNPSTTMKSFAIGSLIFIFLLATPLLARLIPDGSEDDEVLDQKITTVKLPPKEKPPENLPPPPPPPPRVDQVKFVKPVVAKAEEVVEEPPKIEEIKDKKIGDENLKGDPEAPIVLGENSTGPNEIIEEDNTVYNAAGLQVKADYPGGTDKFRKYIADNFTAPDDPNFPGGKVYVSFVVEKDGSITDIKVLRDPGFGTAKEAIRVIKANKVRWSPGEQNGKKVRMLFNIPIVVGRSE